jgi:hypothetical protein
MREAGCNPGTQEEDITMTGYKTVTSWTTGSQRGYIHVADRGHESDIEAIPESLKGVRGNRRRALKALPYSGATHYTVAWHQGVPGKGYSNQYCYAEYIGYVAE